MVILLNKMEVDESVCQVDVLKLLEKVGWNTNSQSFSACLRGALHTGPTEARVPASLPMTRDQMNITPLEAPDIFNINQNYSQ